MLWNIKINLKDDLVFEFMPQLENKASVLKVVNHFKEDIRKEGLFIHEELINNSKFYQMFVNCMEKFDDFKPYAEVEFRFEEGMMLHIPENLDNYGDFTNIKNLVEGTKILTEVQRWAEEHGKLIRRSDSLGIWKGPHASKQYDNLTRPYGAISRIYEVYPEIYDSENF